MTRILYLHGFASGPSSNKAQYFRKRLESAGALVEVPDLAAGDFENLTISGQLAVIDRAVSSQPVSLMGSSMGGYLAALYAARHPEVQRLVLLAPGFGFARRWPQTLDPAQLKAWRSTGRMEMFHYGEGRTRSLGYGLLEDGARYEDYPDFRQPALIFHGSHDDVVPVGFSQDFAASHPNARLEVLDSDHMLLDVLDDIADRVAAFLME